MLRKKINKKRRHGSSFWDKEYTNASHLSLSEKPSSDLEKFIRWLQRKQGKTLLNPTTSVLDIGCGNGRNIIYLAKEFGMHGYGYDISSAAIAKATEAKKELNIEFKVCDIKPPWDIPDNSQSLVLDMMTSHFLLSSERLSLRDEIYRVLKPGGFLFFKTFLRDGDIHTKRLLNESPAEEDGSYIHPIIGVAEHVYYKEEILEFLAPSFIIHKSYASHKHILKGKARKRRTISIYAEKDPYQ